MTDTALPGTAASPARGFRTRILRRCLLLCAAASLVAVATASVLNPWNFTALDPGSCHPLTLTVSAASLLLVELAVSVRHIAFGVMAGAVGACAAMLLLAVSLRPDPVPPLSTTTIATSPDGHVTVVLAEQPYGALYDRTIMEVYLRTSAGLDRETRVGFAYCVDTDRAEVRFVGNRTLEFRDRRGGLRRLTFDKNLTITSAAGERCR